MDIEAKTIDIIFKAINDQIKLHKGQPYSIVVCGCTALIAKGLTNRKTKDVDVLGEVVENNGEINIKKINQFPSWLIRTIYEVSMNFKMPGNWFNAGPTMQLDYGLPCGFESRLEKMEYGDFFNVYYISRFDQIFFKLNHSICVGGTGYQVEDLLNLNPTQEELFQAYKWMLTQYNSESIRESLLHFLKKWDIMPDQILQESLQRSDTH